MHVAIEACMYCFVITVRAQCALFSLDAGDIRSNPVLHALLVHSTRTLVTDFDKRVRESFTASHVTFDFSATIRDRH